MTGSDITIATLARMKQGGEKIAALTCYDATFTCVLEAAGVEVLLVGDSLGMVVQGHPSTLPVRVSEMIYHTRSVARARRHALLVTDMPFMSYSSRVLALSTAARLMREGGAHMVKIEGGAARLGVVGALTQQGIPVCAHLGLLPQSVHQLGGYRVQGRSSDEAKTIEEDALAMQDAGASLLILECIPAALAARVAARLRIPVIGIGAGPGCDGQVLVLYDMLGIQVAPRPRFVKDFLQHSGSVHKAIEAYVQAVKAGTFPGSEHCYQ
jgi:3-methyl-2-oxobutanoate hydroxymethyltransferase